MRPGWVCGLGVAALFVGHVGPPVAAQQAGVPGQRPAVIDELGPIDLAAMLDAAVWAGPAVPAPLFGGYAGPFQDGENVPFEVVTKWRTPMRLQVHGFTGEAAQAVDAALDDLADLVAPHPVVRVQTEPNLVVQPAGYDGAAVGGVGLARVWSSQDEHTICQDVDQVTVARSQNRTSEASRDESYQSAVMAP